MIKKLILVVDDEVDITDTYKMLLEFYEYSVLTANTAVEALTIVTDNPPDLIVSDCMMPMMDGVEFSRRVRFISGLEETPIILMSGAPELHDFSRSAHTTFFRKPLVFEQLIKAIENLLS
jgi:CheY-like chemotaxis protein